jgi:type IV secretion system protein VirB10
MGMPPEEAFGYEEEQGLDTGAPAVAASKGKTMLVMLVLGGIIFFLLYSIFSGGDDDTPDGPKQIEVAPSTVNAVPNLPEENQPVPIPISRPEFNAADDDPAIAIPEPEPAALPDLPDPDPVEPANINPVFVPPPITAPVLEPVNDGLTLEQRQARQRSEILILDNSGGGLFGGGDTNVGGNRGGAIDGDPNRAFAETAVNTEVERSVATRLGDLRRVIAQGRIIEGTLETVINTDLPATVRAIVSRDVYGEAGSKPLIPKGSRIIGTYSTNIQAGQSRVFVVWQRIIRPDGIDIAVGSTGTDAIGQAGLTGQIDTKFQEILSRSVLASAISIAFAIAGDELNGDDNNNTSTTIATTGTTQEGNAASTATVNALNRLGSVSEEFLTRFINVNPTILVDQGSPVNIIVSRDLIFPPDIAGTRVVN